MNLDGSFFDFGVGGSPHLGNSPIGRARRTEPRRIPLWNGVELVAYETYIRMDGNETCTGTTAKYYFGESWLNGKRNIRTQRVPEDSDLRKLFSKILRIEGYKGPYIF